MIGSNNNFLSYKNHMLIIGENMASSKCNNKVITSKIVSCKNQPFQLMPQRNKQNCANQKTCDELFEVI